MTGFTAFIVVAFVVVMASGHPHDGPLRREERYIRDGQGSQGHTGYPRNQEGLGGGYNQGGQNQRGYNQAEYNQGGHQQGGYPQGGHHQAGRHQSGHQQGHGQGYQTHGY